MVFSCKSCGYIVNGTACRFCGWLISDSKHCQNDNLEITRDMKKDILRHVLINHPEKYRNMDMSLQKKGFSKKIRDQVTKEILR